MKLNQVIKNMEAAGAKVTSKSERMYVAEFSGANVEFINDEGDVDNLYVIGKKSRDDIQSDYFPGTFARNTKHAIELAKAHE